MVNQQDHFVTLMMPSNKFFFVQNLVKIKIFTILDIEHHGYLSYDDIRVFFTMTKVYDKSKYPKKMVKRRSSYKIHPE